MSFFVGKREAEILFGGRGGGFEGRVKIGSQITQVVLARLKPFQAGLIKISLFLPISCALTI